jgi:hypothetical protein
MLDPGRECTLTGLVAFNPIMVEKVAMASRHATGSGGIVMDWPGEQAVSISGRIGHGTRGDAISCF